MEIPFTPPLPVHEKSKNKYLGSCFFPKIVFIIIFSMVYEIEGITQVRTRILSSETIRDYNKYHIDEAVPILKISIPNVDSFLNEDLKKEKYVDRYGVPVETRINATDGIVYNYRSVSIWKIGLYAENATSLELRFSSLNLPPESEMYIYGYNNKMVLGPIGPEIPHEGIFNSDLVYGDSIFVSIKMRTEDLSDFSLSINKVIYGIKSRFRARAFGDALPCNENVECFPDWRDQIDAVCLILDNGIEHCSGALITDACISFTPYILTASHCLSLFLENYKDWIFRFSYESPTCEPDQLPDSWITFSGSELVSNWSGTDFGLLKLKSDVNNNDLSFSGWDRTLQQPFGTTFIHHPAGDVKKLTFDGGQSTIFNSYFFELELDNNVFNDFGTLEGGSSGSPQFNADHRIIAQHYGGTLPSCDEPMNKVTGRFFSSWSGGGSSSNSLEPHLGDPNGSPNTMDAVRYPDVDGDGVICDDEIYSLNNNLPGSNVSWSVQPTGLFDGITSGTGITAELSPAGGAFGLAELTFTLTNFGCEPLEISEQFWVGKPDFDIDASDEICLDDTRIPASIMPKGNYGTTSYSWDIYGTIEEMGSGSELITKFRHKSGAGPGPGTICYTAANECGSTTKCVTVDVVDCSEGGGGLRAYPNPAKDKLSITFDRQMADVKSENMVNYYLINKYGQIVRHRLKNYQSCDFDLKNLYPGLYIVKVETDNALFTKKVIISP